MLINKILNKLLKNPAKQFSPMSHPFLREAGEKNDDDYLYSKSGDEDDRLRKEYFSVSHKLTTLTQ